MSLNTDDHAIDVAFDPIAVPHIAVSDCRGSPSLIAPEGMAAKLKNPLI